MKRKIITIDGLAGSGKTSIAGKLAKEIGFIFLNSGLLYRAVASLVLDNNLRKENNINGDSIYNEEDIKKLFAANLIQLTCKEDITSNEIYVNNKIYKRDFHTLSVSQLTSQIASLDVVRRGLIEIQRNAFYGKNIVAEGRDMGSVVFPDADIKFYIESPIEIKAIRRYHDLYSFSIESDEGVKLLNNVMSEIQQRDKRDEERTLKIFEKNSDKVNIIINKNKSFETIITEIKNQLLKKNIL